MVLNAINVELLLDYAKPLIKKFMSKAKVFFVDDDNVVIIKFKEKEDYEQVKKLFR